MLEKDRAKKIVIVIFETSDMGSSNVRHRSYMAAESSERSVP